MEDLNKLLLYFLGSVSVDESWYCKTYPDIKKAIEQGVVTSARSHFIPTGYLEGRQPHETIVDETWYLQTYPDIKKAIADGEVKSAQDHYLNSGYREGRLAHQPKPE